MDGFASKLHFVRVAASASLSARNVIPLLAGAVLLLAVQPAAAESAALSIDEKETFLTTAEVVSRKRLSEGTTGSLIAVMSDRRITHDVHIQTVDEYRRIHTTPTGVELNFRDSYKTNVAAYRLARLLGLGHMCPPSIEREFDGRPAAYTWWVDDVLMTEKQRYFKKERPPDANRWNQQMFIVRVFDQLICNMDRNLGNLAIDKRWNLHMIDHTRSFRTDRGLRHPEHLKRCDRQLLDSLRKLDEAALRKELEPLISGGEVAALLARRNEIVELFDAKIRDSSKIAVLYEYLSTR